MDTLSVELHIQIFEYACLDDGTTARALSLVSHYISAAARPFLYQSLAVAGPTQLRALEARLITIPHYLRRIRHLFLSHWASAQVDPATSRSQRVPSDEASLERYEEERDIAARVLRLAAPTLETLALVASCPYTSTPLIAYLFALSLPHLTELSIRGFYPYPSVLSTGDAPFPHLAQLHLAGNRNPHGLLALGALAGACPALTHLCVSGVVSAPSFATELEDVLAARGTECGAEDMPAGLTSLRRVVVQLGALPKNAGALALLGHAKMAGVLERLAVRDANAQGQEGRPGRVAVRYGQDADGERLLGHWKARLDGAEGVWAA